MFIEKITNVEQNEYAVSGTSLVGHIVADYNKLVEVFGEPTVKAEDEGGFDKVWTEWDLQFTVLDEDGDEDTVTETIYDWKEEGPYASRQDPKYRWHIGGNGYEAEECVEKFINEGLTSA